MSFKQHIYQQPQFGEDWFSYQDLYRDIVRKFPSGSTFVEVGSWKGKSSAFLATEIANSNKNIKFYCVDTWEGSLEHQDNTELKMLYDIFLTNMISLSEYYEPIKKTSLEAVNMFEDKSLDFVFIDASHEYNDVKNDILAWAPKIKKDGVLAGHDYDVNAWIDVVRAVNDTLPLFTVDIKQKCFIYNNE